MINGDNVMKLIKKSKKKDLSSVIGALTTFDEQLNFVLSRSYNLIARMEQSMLSRSKRFNLSISELKMLEVIHRYPDGAMIGQIANDLYITPSSVTTAVNCLENKNHVSRRRGRDDGRKVFVNLTDSGKHAVRIHKRFHRNFANAISKDITNDEKEVLLKCIERMNDFMADRINNRYV